MIEKHLIPIERVAGKILLIRGKKVILARDLAELYGVETKVLNQAVKRNAERFPEDFMFELNQKEFENLRSQFVTSSLVTHGGERYLPMAFTEHGILMLSSVLKSERAILVNIQIVRTFVKLREMLSSHREITEKIEQMEKKYDKHFKIVFDTLRQLLKEEEKPKNKIGFRSHNL